MSSPSFDCPFEKLVILGVSAFPAQARLWPELAGTPAVPTITDAAVEAMADDFERRFRTQLVDVFSPAGLRRIWTDIGLGYIRFSDEGSNPRSLDQQLINVLQRARRDGVFIPWHSICADYAVSGTLACRRGYIVAKMLVERRAETGVAWFIIDDLGRMNRNALESLRLGEFVEATQVRLIGASDGFDSSNQQSKIMLAMMSSFNEVFIDQLKAKVHRGQSDTFRRGGIVQHPGFGYRLVDVLSDDGKPVLTRKGTIQKRVEIDPDAAEWIVRGAGMIVRDNRSPGAVAVVFNDNNVGGTRTWSSNRIRRLYARERLVGIEVFRKTKQVRDRDTGHVDVVPNDRGEWMTRECPEMRILSDELAEAVKAKLRSCETLSTFTGRESGRQAGAMAGGGVRGSPTSRSCRSIRRRGPKSARTAARRVPAATSDAGRRGRRSTRRVAEHLEGWLENRTVAEQPVSAHVERELRSYLTCGILCFGFGRARCASCGQGFVVAFSCKGRGVCPSCNGRRMAQTAAHLVDRVIPPVPVRQWVISVPKRLRGFLADRPQAVAALTRIFLSEIERWFSVRRGADGRIAKVRYVLPRHKAANWVGPGRGRKSTRPGAIGNIGKRGEHAAHEPLISSEMVAEVPLAGLSLAIHSARSPPHVSVWPRWSIRHVAVPRLAPGAFMGGTSRGTHAPPAGFEPPLRASSTTTGRRRRLWSLPS